MEAGVASSGGAEDGIMAVSVGKKMKGGVCRGRGSFAEVKLYT
jgi:hypothetical protein